MAWFNHLKFTDSSVRLEFNQVVPVVYSHPLTWSTAACRTTLHWQGFAQQTFVGVQLVRPVRSTTSKKELPET